MISLRRKEGESVNALLYRFSKKVQQARILKESKKRRFHDRASNARARKESTLYRLEKQQEIDTMRKLGKR